MWTQVPGHPRIFPNPAPPYSYHWDKSTRGRGRTDGGKRGAWMELWMKSAQEKPTVEKTERGREARRGSRGGCQLAGRAQGTFPSLAA